MCKRVEIKTKRYFSIREAAQLFLARTIFADLGPYTGFSTLIFEIDDKDCCRFVDALEQEFGSDVEIRIREPGEVTVGADS